jgi:hypothetical protein
VLIVVVPSSVYVEVRVLVLVTGLGAMVYTNVVVNAGI